MNSSFYVPFFGIYYKFYIIIGISLQSVQLFLIFKKSSSAMNHLRIFLYNTSTAQVFVLFTTFISQHRLLPNLNTTAILSSGPSVWCPPTIRFSLYHIYTAISTLAGVGVSITVFYRYLVLKGTHMDYKKICIIVSTSYIGPLILLLVPFLDNWDFEKVRTATYMEHPTYEFAIYEPITGFANTSSPQFILGTSIIALIAYVIPVICALSTRQILVLIGQQTNMSANTKKHSKNLIYGLICQTLFPIIFYTPIFSCYLYTQATGNGILITEHFYLSLSSLPALVDPLVSFYFIIPFRKYILKKIGMRNQKAYIDKRGITSSFAIRVE
ncbi:unnamed protein product [Caenorhabditis bovis]|uniref:G-protein coupled receptors family 1 profile domain-containing protein n=1 Tax=Caenorhabditis bovis TaxID=2654633 RepID=A0A8S1EUT9_9PELO|nr:unnamed protein product [Caenorhabditis bovis]